MTTPEGFDPELAAELRSTAGAEWTDDAAEDERLTEVHRRRLLDLPNLFEDLMHRRQRVSVEFGGHSFNGALIAVGSDYALISGPGQVAEVRLSSGRWSVLPTMGAEAPPPVSAAETFIGVLRTHESSQDLVRLSLPQNDMVIGRVETVGADHVEFAEADERQIYVPLELILGVIRSIDPH